jgi:hypothetical protein
LNFTLLVRCVDSFLNCFLIPRTRLGLLVTSMGLAALDLAGPSRPTSRPGDLWFFFPIGYLFTVAVETPVLLIGLTRRLSFKQRLFAGLWLTACTYPIVVLVLPIVLSSFSRSTYLLVAEVFAALGECALFLVAFKGQLESGFTARLRNCGVIIAANVLSFIGGELLNSTRWFGLF